MSEIFRDSISDNDFLERAKIHASDLDWFHQSNINEKEVNQAEEIFYRKLSKISSEIVKKGDAKGVDIKEVINLYLLAPNTANNIYKNYLSEIMAQNGYSPMEIESIVVQINSDGQIPTLDRVLARLAERQTH